MLQSAVAGISDSSRAQRLDEPVQVSAPVSKMRMSLRLLPEGPVTIVSPSAANSGEASKRPSAAAGSRACRLARAYVVLSTTAPAATLLPSIPSDPAESRVPPVGNEAAAKSANC